MRHVFALMLATLFTLSSVPAAAQAPDDSTTSVGRSLPIDNWIADPVPIELSREQRTAFDSIRSLYVEDWHRIRDRAEDRDQAGVVLRMRNLRREYREKVRRILTPEQLPAFEKNVRAPRIGG